MYFWCNFVPQKFTVCRIGSPSCHTATDAHWDHPPSTEQHKPSRSTFKSLFGSMTKAAMTTPTVGVTNLPLGSHDEYWGPPITLHGRVSTVCVFSDVVTPAQFRALSSTGIFIPPPSKVDGPPNFTCFCLSCFFFG